MTPATDCPTCAKCHAPTMSATDGETGRLLAGRWLECRACGATSEGTPEEREQAEHADEAWELECLRIEREEEGGLARRVALAWISRAGSAARPAPEPRPEPETLPLPGVR